MSGRGRFNTRSSAQQNYSQKQSYNTRNSYNAPAYSTPPSYNKEPQQPPQQQQQQYTPPAQQTPPPPQPAAPATPVVEPVTPKVQPPATPQLKPENNVQAEDTSMGEEDEEGKKKTKTWMKRRAPEVKIPRRIRKRRQNARLKNLLAPKNAMMVLHELHPELKMSITEQVNAANQMSYSVEIEVLGQVHKGMGMSKMAAKQAGSEAALKAVLLRRLEDNQSNPAASAAVAAAAAAGNKVDGGWEEDVTMADVSAMKAAAEGSEEEQNGEAPSKPRQIPEDDVPWGSLASFALYKLFTEWQSQGFQLPALSGLQNVPGPRPQVPKAPTPMKTIPEDAHTKHPVQLLNQIRPGSQYVESREGVPPNLTFTFTVTIDDLSFKGVGNSKKEAKKLCAKHALEHLGVVYPD